MTKASKTSKTSKTENPTSWFFSPWVRTLLRGLQNHKGKLTIACQSKDGQTTFTLKNGSLFGEQSWDCRLRISFDNDSQFLLNPINIIKMDAENFVVHVSSEEVGEDRQWMKLDNDCDTLSYAIVMLYERLIRDSHVEIEMPNRYGEATILKGVVQILEDDADCDFILKRKWQDSNGIPFRFEDLDMIASLQNYYEAEPYLVSKLQLK
jgi:hypothetical protein